MFTPRLMKLRKQPNSTWAQLQKRLIALPDPFETLFPAEVWSFFSTSRTLLAQILAMFLPL